MPAYSFEALDANGQTRKGVIDADTAKAARGLLRAQALVPLAVESVSGSVAADGTQAATGFGRQVLWARLDESVKRRFKQKLLKDRLQQPRVAKDALHGLPNFYKIKITTPQFRLAYHVNDAENLLTIVAISSRDDVYLLLQSRQS